MSRNLFSSQSAQLQEAFEALRRDLIHDDGPQISTMRNYRFAILQYQPEDEFKVRIEVQRLVQDLKNASWHILTISLQKLLLDRVRAEGEEWVERVITMEKRMHGVSPDRGLSYLRDRVAPLIEGPDGIAADCSRIICEHAEQHPDELDRTVAVIGRAGSLYPFFRSSSLLKHLDGRTMNVPVVLLYPGERRGDKGLSFMGVLSPDSDYRPRIYP